jgi:hypothetical protein
MQAHEKMLCKRESEREGKVMRHDFMSDGILQMRIHDHRII